MVVFLNDRLYAKSHEWIKLEDGEDLATCGISDYAQEELNDIVYVELPAVGDSLTQGERFAVVESVKAASDVFMPVGGEIVEINDALEGAPQLVNEDPFGKGWMVKIRVRDRAEAAQLLDAKAYEKLCSEEGG
jgi:glycine cleavage system H protein